MNKIESYKPKDNKFQYILKKAEKIGFNQSYYIGNKALMTYYYLKNTMFKNNDSKLLIVNLDFKKYVPVIYKNKYQKEQNAFKDILSYTFEDNICYESKLKEEIETYETLFILFDCPNYDYCWDKTYVTHSTCAIIHKGECYYINPHGGVCGPEYHKWYQWNEKTKGVTYCEFDQHVDQMVISCLMKEMNIKYDLCPSNTFNGAGLQSYDNYGCCFIFPIAIWFEFENNYKKYIDLLKRGLLITMIDNIFTKANNCNKLPNLMLYHLSQKNLKMHVEKQKYRLVKNTLNKYIGYMSQKNIQEKIIY